MTVEELVEILNTFDGAAAVYVRVDSQLHPILDLTAGGLNFNPEIAVIVTDHTEVLA